MCFMNLENVCSQVPQSILSAELCKYELLGSGTLHICKNSQCENYAFEIFASSPLVHGQDININ